VKTGSRVAEAKYKATEVQTAKQLKISFIAQKSK
jgi:hypothetical protein